MSRGMATRATDASLTDAPPTSALTGAEITFATAAGIPICVFDDAAGMASDLHFTTRSACETIPEGPRFTTAQVAERLNRRPANVRRMLGRGDLYSAGRLERQIAYPARQFTSPGVLPHLRQIIAVLPTDYHPRDVFMVMTSPMEELNGRSPRAWLEAGGDPMPVLELFQELSL